MTNVVGFSLRNEPPPESDEETITRLAGLSPMEYDRVRKAEAKRLSVKLSTLDIAVENSRPVDITPGTAGTRPIHLAAPEPWADPVDTAEILDELVDTLNRHVIMARETAIGIALWVAHTWVFENYERTPRLAITSATKRCGKSTLMEILRSVSRRALLCDSISSSGVFRVVEALTPITLLIDEADSFLPDNEELRGILNSGFAKHGQTIRIIESERKLTPGAFRTFAPVALAAIKGIPPTIEDRSVPIRLVRKVKGESVTLLRSYGSREKLDALASKLARWSDDAREKLNPDPAVPDAMGDREGDISVPLISIADHAGTDWGEKARQALLDLFGSRARDDGEGEIGIRLLRDIWSVFDERRSTIKAADHRSTETNPDRISSNALCMSLMNIDAAPWSDWNRGREITPSQLARLLKPFRIQPATVRSRVAKTEKGYHREYFEEAWERYEIDADNEQNVPASEIAASVQASRPKVSDHRAAEHRAGQTPRPSPWHRNSEKPMENRKGVRPRH
jgi:putative DNA primase/helicase